MAIIGTGKPQCPICGKDIENLDEVIAFPPFLKSTHSLAKFSYAEIHKRCSQQCADRADVELLLSRFKELMAKAPQNCTLKEYESWINEIMREFE